MLLYYILLCFVVKFYKKSLFNAYLNIVNILYNEQYLKLYYKKNL